MARKKQNTRIKARQPFNFPWKMTAYAMIPVLIIAAISYARYWLNDTSNLTISNVEVNGELKYSDQKVIQQIIEPFVKTNLYLIDAHSLEEELEFEPWIKSIAITKRWPTDLVVEITEQSPVAFWGKDRLLNHLGEIFDATLPEKEGVMPMLYHPEDKGLEMIQQYKQIQQWLKANLVGNPVGVSEYIVNARGSWRIRLTNGWLVEIGKIDQEKRIRRFLVAYKKGLNDKTGKVKKIDLRYTNGLAVSWK